MPEMNPDCSFTLIRFNPRRMRPGCSGAAEVEVCDGQNSVRLWMSVKDIERNIADHGPYPGLLAARDAYRRRVEYPPRTVEESTCS